METMRISIASLAVALIAGCGLGEREVSFRDDVQPILQANCVSCHIAPDGKGFTKSELQLDTYEHLMKGTKFGPVIVAGSSVSSTLNILVEGKADPSISMPHGGDPMSEADKETLQEWVDQGAKDN
jgi:hypothetical protein